MVKKWEEEKFSRFEKDFIGRLLAIAGLLIVLMAASAFSDIYVAIFGFALFMTGRVIIFRAA